MSWSKKYRRNLINQQMCWCLTTWYLVLMFIHKKSRNKRPQEFEMEKTLKAQRRWTDELTGRAGAYRLGMRRPCCCCRRKPTVDLYVHSGVVYLSAAALRPLGFTLFDPHGPQFDLNPLLDRRNNCCTNEPNMKVLTISLVFSCETTNRSTSLDDAPNV
jgi:hypothetical protein